MAKTQRRWLTFVQVFCASMWIWGHVTTAPAGTSVRIAIQHDALTATLEHVPLEAVLAEIQRQTALRYTLPPTEARRLVSGHFHAVPLTAALRQMLSPVNYALQVDASGTVRTLVILGSDHPEPNGPGQGLASGDGSVMGRVPSREDPILTTPASSVPLMVIRPVQGEAMSITPASSVPLMVIRPVQGEAMSITPASSAPLMVIRPVQGEAMPITPASAVTDRSIEHVGHTTQP